MRIHSTFAAAPLALAVTLAASGPAWGSPEGSSGESLGAQPSKPQTPIAVRFEASAASLPQEEIRAAVARELEHRRLDAAPVAGELTVGIEADHLIARFRSADGYTERLLPLPEDRTQVPLLLALLASTLASDQVAALRRVTPPVPERPPPAATARRAPAASYKHHYLGLHVAQDVAFVGGSNLCDPYAGAPNENYACFYAGTEDPFFHRPAPSTDSIDKGAALATTRVLVSYDLAPWSVVSFGLRAGLAFRGGPPAGMAPADTGVVDAPFTIPAHSSGQGGTAFFPYHFELRASYWFLPLTNPTWRAYAGAGVGLAQVDAKVRHGVVDCEDVGQAAGGSADAYAACVSSNAGATTVPTTELDAWKKEGQAFAALHAGGTLTLVGDLAAELNVNVMFMSPWGGVVLEPSLGVVMGL